MTSETIHVKSLIQLLAILVACPHVFAADSQTAVKPNVLFIAIDDLNDWIGCMHGHPQTITPNLDRLAASGVLFTNAHCPAPACNPSRSAIFTGRAPNRSGCMTIVNRCGKSCPMSPSSLSTFATKVTMQPVQASCCITSSMPKAGMNIFPKQNRRIRFRILTTPSSARQLGTRRPVAICGNGLGGIGCIG